jgi:hypothetical protein
VSISRLKWRLTIPSVATGGVDAKEAASAEAVVEEEEEDDDEGTLVGEFSVTSFGEGVRRL